MFSCYKIVIIILVYGLDLCQLGEYFDSCELVGGLQIREIEMITHYLCGAVDVDFVQRDEFTWCCPCLLEEGK